jgi:Predicted transcriptional regulator
MQLELLFPNPNRYVRFLLGMYLKRKRTEMAYSEEFIANHLGLKEGSYKKLESGHMNFTNEHFVRLQNLLSFEADDLIEIRKIVDVQFINNLSAEMSENFPR